MPITSEIVILSVKEKNGIRAAELEQHLKIAFDGFSIKKSIICADIEGLKTIDLQQTEKIVLLADNQIVNIVNKLPSSSIEKCILIFEEETGLTQALGLKNPQYRFFDTELESGQYRQYTSNNPETSTLYWSQILAIAYDICFQSSEKQIYIAETTPDLYQYRNAVCSELSHRGFNTVPKHKLTGTLDEISAQVEEYLKSSSMSVHLIGSHYGAHITQTDVSITELQCRLAAKKWRLSSQKEGEIFQRIIWLPPYLKAADDRQQRFIETLKIEDKNDASEILQVPLEDMKSSLRNKILSFSDPGNLHHNTNSIYVIHDFKDLEKAEALSAFLQAQGNTILKIEKNIAPECIVSKHLEYLASAGSAIIIANNNNYSWLKSKIKDLIKAPGYGRQKPFLAKAIFTNQSENIKNQNLNDILTLNSSLPYKEALLPFFEKLKNN